MVQNINKQNSNMILMRVRNAQLYVVTNRIIQGLKGNYRTYGSKLYIQ